MGFWNVGKKKGNGFCCISGKVCKTVVTPIGLILKVDPTPGVRHVFLMALRKYSDPQMCAVLPGPSSCLGGGEIKCASVRE